MSFFKDIVQECPFCHIDTRQSPSPTDDGYTLTCKRCGRPVQTVNVLDMMNMLTKRGFPSEPPMEVSTVDAARVKVFIKHHLGESEASTESVQQHIRITGELPMAGKKLLALPKGMIHKAFAIPIAEVIRVEPIH